MPPICLDCGIAMRCTKNGILVHDPPTPTFEATYWAADEYTCPTCKRRIATGFSRPQSGIRDDLALVLEATEFRHG